MTHSYPLWWIIKWSRCSVSLQKVLHQMLQSRPCFCSNNDRKDQKTQVKLTLTSWNAAFLLTAQICVHTLSLANRNAITQSYSKWWLWLDNDNMECEVPAPTMFCTLFHVDGQQSYLLHRVSVLWTHEQTMFPSDSNSWAHCPLGKVRDTESIHLFIPDTWQRNWALLLSDLLILYLAIHYSKLMEKNMISQDLSWNDENWWP